MILTLAFVVGGPPEPAEVLVSAATSVTEVLTGIARDFERQTGVRPVLNFAASNTLARQIAAGAPVDVFLSADTAQMDVASRAGRIVEDSRVDLLANQLVIVVPAGTRRTVTAPRDLLASDFRRIAVGDPAAVPAGVYARQYLEGLGLWAPLQPRIIPTINVRGALAAVEGGHADAALVYITDARTSPRVAIAFTVPRDQGPRIVYPLALVKRAGSSPAARRFYEYLMSSSAHDAFTRAGFVPLTSGQGRGSHDSIARIDATCSPFDSLASCRADPP
jgi:molybdate transport system substrate-binding protein